MLSRSQHLYMLVLLLFVFTTLFWVGALPVFYPTSAVVQNSAFPASQFARDRASKVLKRVRCTPYRAKRDSFHVVIAGYDYTDFAEHYLWDTGWSNARFFLYRRTAPEKSRRHWKGPCGMVAEEVLLFPNHGRDGAAFYDHLLTHRSAPPDYLVFLHGHAAISWHTSCESVLSRVDAFYSQAASGDLSSLPGMVTLTKHDYSPALNSTVWDKRLGQKRRLLQGDSTEEKMCTDILATVTNLTKSSLYSCCASFIINFRVPRRILPKHTLEKLRQLLLNTSLDDTQTGRICFEYIVYDLFNDGMKDKRQLDHWHSWSDARIPHIGAREAYIKCKSEERL